MDLKELKDKAFHNLILAVRAIDAIGVLESMMAGNEPEPDQANIITEQLREQAELRDAASRADEVHVPTVALGRKVRGKDKKTRSGGYVKPVVGQRQTDYLLDVLREAKEPYLDVDVITHRMQDKGWRYMGHGHPRHSVYPCLSMVTRAKFVKKINTNEGPRYMMPNKKLVWPAKQLPNGVVHANG